MEKKYIFILLIIFAIVTFTVVSIDTSTVRRVSVTSQNMNFKADNSAPFQNSDVTMSSRAAKINQTTLDLQNKRTAFENQENKFKNNLDSDIKRFDSENSNKIDYNNSNITFKNKFPENEESTSSTKKESYSQSALDNSSQKSDKRKQRYLYKNIDWSTWKSNFVNKILDDSMYIRALDLYDKNTWFYYSFYVTSKGEIEDIKIKSVALKSEDRKLIKRLIESYAYQDITVFPANSRRERVKVEALMLLGDYEKKSNPSDFNEHEQIRIPY